jgi:hypothetical protein
MRPTGSSPDAGLSARSPRVLWGRPILWRVALAALVVAVVPARAAADDPADYTLKVVVLKARAPSPPPGTPPPEGPQPEPAIEGTPILRAISSGRVGLTAKDFLLKRPDTEPPAKPLEATKSVTYRDSDEPMAMVLLVQGNFRWMGNETYTDPNDPEAGSIYDGAYKGLGPAIEVLAKAGPSGSKAALLVYAQGVLVKQALGDTSSMTSAALGSQQEYSEFISKQFSLGLSEAWKLLANQPDARKILVVFGDGQDDKEDISAELKKATTDLKESGVEVYTVFYSTAPEDGPQGQQNMAKVGYTDHFTATSRDNFASLADNISETIGAKYYVDFPGDKLPWDGADHEFALSISNVDKEPKTLTLPVLTVPKPPEEEGSSWWIWLIVILALILLIVIVIIIMKRQPAIEMPMEAPPVAAGPMKTVMLGVGGAEDSMPIVGWIVPLGGPNQYQTFKLLQGATKVGTGGEAHIVVGDSFMSSEHAEIACSANGFMLNDLGSTNGTYVNGRRVSSHELVDNDVFKLGKTDFKFKSIN